MPFTDLGALYPVGAPLPARDLPEATTRVRLSTPFGEAWRGPARRGRLEVGELAPATYRLEALRADRPVGWTTVAVGSPGDTPPVPAFATSFASIQEAGAAGAWLLRLRATLVQIYDWMASYTEPLPTVDHYRDPLGRACSLAALRGLAARLTAAGACAQAYLPIGAADPRYARMHPDQTCHDEGGQAVGLGDGLLTVMDPGHAGWRRHWVERYGAAGAAIGFTGFHLDTYGYPRVARRPTGTPIDMRRGCQLALDAGRRAWPRAVLTLNQVNGVPTPVRLPAPPRARYVEVWPPNTSWRHWEGLLRRVQLGEGEHPVLAVYPPVWGGDRRGALRSCGRTEAVATMLGAQVMLHGDRRGVLDHPYYPHHATLTPAEAERLLHWHLFALQCRGLFAAGTDTSWEDVGDPNGGVRVTSVLPAAPEPIGGGWFTRVRRGDGWVAVGLLNCAGSREGRWTKTCAETAPVAATLDVLVASPSAWRARVATLTGREGRFEATPSRVVSGPHGPMVRVRLPPAADWAVLLLHRPGAHP